mgnify:CR=1 FL=1
MSEVNVTGTLIWYYFICKREVWLMSRQLEPDQDQSNIDLGRFLHEQSYQKDKKEVSLGHIVIDIIKKENGQLVVGEVKKTSKFRESARMQLLYYLKQLKDRGIQATGSLTFPKEKKKEEVILTEEDEKRLEAVVNDILRIIYLEKPPKVEKIPFCKNCAYNELCYA